jgi:hypothetical protein
LLTPVIPATWRLRWGGSRFKASLGKEFGRPISKITRAKWTGGVAQKVESLLCKHKALSSNTSPTKGKKNQIEMIVGRGSKHL